MKAAGYGTAQVHGPTVVAARKYFLEELNERFPRSSAREREQLIDYMIGARYLSADFFDEWSLGDGDA